MPAVCVIAAEDAAYCHLWRAQSRYDVGRGDPAAIDQPSDRTMSAETLQHRP